MCVCVCVCVWCVCVCVLSTVCSPCHSLPAVKEHVVDQVRQQADAMLGMSMTFTLFEWVKESATDLMVDQKAAPVVSQVADEVEQLTVSQVSRRRRRRDDTELPTGSSSEICIDVMRLFLVMDAVSDSGRKLSRERILVIVSGEL